jgi:hypothetical protein
MESTAGVLHACECMVAKPMSMANLRYNMHIVLYFGVLIWSSFGGVSEHRNTYTESLLTANKKIDMNYRYVIYM